MTGSGTRLPDASPVVLTLPNDLRALQDAAAEVDAFIALAGATAEAAHLIRLVVEEIASNIIRYAWADRAPHAFQVRLSRDGDRALVEFRDDGHPFDPLGFRPLEPHRPPHERTGRGLGIHLVRSLAAAMNYARQGEFNVLTVAVPLTSR